MLSLARHRIRRLRQLGSLRPVTVLRALWMSLVLRYNGETCNRCARRYGGLVWWAPQPLWDEVAVVPGDYHHRTYGLLCPRCLDELARAEGYRLIWTPMVKARDGVPTTNWWLDQTRDALLMGEPDPGYFPDGKVRQPQPTWARVADAYSVDAPSPYPAENLA